MNRERHDDPPAPDSLSRMECESRVRLLRFPFVEQSRGNLISFDYSLLPFVPRRSFLVTGVPKGTVRGEHAHKACEQVLICLKGRLTVEVAFGENRAEVTLKDPSRGLYVGAGVWARQRYEEEGTQLLVFASLPFDPDSYVQEERRA
jgi:hypothetical protein